MALTKESILNTIVKVKARDLHYELIEDGFVSDNGPDNHAIRKQLVAKITEAVNQVVKDYPGIISPEFNIKD